MIVHSPQATTKTRKIQLTEWPLMSLHFFPSKRRKKAYEAKQKKERERERARCLMNVN